MRVAARKVTKRLISQEFDVLELWKGWSLDELCVRNPTALQMSDGRVPEVVWCEKCGVWMSLTVTVIAPAIQP